MNAFVLLAIAVGLAMDAFAVSVAAGIRLGCDLRSHHTIRLSFSFGFFQFFMTVLGWSMGYSVVWFIRAYEHWVAFVLLVFIGGKMIYDSLVSGASGLRYDPTRGIHVVILSVATSIDALAVGLSLGVLNSGIWYPSLVIGVVAAAFTMTGIILGCRVGMRFSHRVEIFGGVILIAIACKILFEHLAKGI